MTLPALLARGVRTSEFWLSLAAILAPAVDAAVQRATDHLAAPAAAGDGSARALAASIGAAAIAGAYSAGRAYVKGKTAAAAVTAAGSSASATPGRPAGVNAWPVPSAADLAAAD